MSLTISGLSVSGRHSLEQPRHLLGVCSHDQAGLHVRAGHVELERRDLVAGRKRADQLGHLGRLKPITLTISGTGSSARPGQVGFQITGQTLVGQPDRVHQPGRQLPQPGGGLPWRGARVTVLDTKAANGKFSSSSSPKARRAARASKVPEALMIGWASSMPAKVGQWPIPGVASASGPSWAASSTGPSRHRRT